MSSVSSGKSVHLCALVSSVSQVCCKLRVMEPWKSLQAALLEQLVVPQGMLESQKDGRESRSWLAPPPEVAQEELTGQHILEPCCEPAAQSAPKALLPSNVLSAPSLKCFEEISEAPAESRILSCKDLMPCFNSNSPALSPHLTPKIHK